MPVAELVRAEPERAAEDLVAEADAEQRDFAAQHAPRQLDRVVGGGRVARAGREEHRVRAERADVVERWRSPAARAWSPRGRRAGAGRCA